MPNQEAKQLLEPTCTSRRWELIDQAADVERPREGLFRFGVEDGGKANGLKRYSYTLSLLPSPCWTRWTGPDLGGHRLAQTGGIPAVAVSHFGLSRALCMREWDSLR